jgi:ribosomal protein S18 acetylase RimI-like enzyme
MTELRPARFEDYTAIAALHAQSWKRHYRGIYFDIFLEQEVENDRLAVWRERLETPPQNQRVTIAVQNGAVIGFSCIYINDHPAFGTLLDNLHVSAHHQQSGIGRMLLQACARLILEQGEQPNMYLWVYEQNVQAVKVYEHLGGRRYETVLKQNADGGSAVSHRYVWPDVAVLAH